MPLISAFVVGDDGLGAVVHGVENDGVVGVIHQAFDRRQDRSQVAPTVVRSLGSPGPGSLFDSLQRRLSGL